MKISRTGAIGDRGSVSRFVNYGLKALAFLCVATVLGGCKKDEVAGDAIAPKVKNDEVVFPTNAPQLAAISVEVTQPRKQLVNHATGRLYWNDEKTVRIYTPVSGRVIRVLADVGTAITNDMPLAEIDSPDFGQTLATARTAVGNLAAADKAYSRAQDLLTHGAAAAKDVEAAQAAYVAAKAERDRALAQLANYGGSLDSTNSLYLLRSPIAGVLVDKSINPGEELRADMMLGNVPQTFNPLFIVSDPASLWLQLDVGEADLATLKKGLALRINSKAFPDKIFDGTIENIGDTLDSATRTVKVRGVVNNPNKLLKAEMYVQVDIIHDAGNLSDAGVNVPSRALFFRDDNYYVFVEQSRGEFQRQRVKIGEELDGMVPVLEGVTPGQRVVTEGALLLQALVEPSS